MGVSLNRDSLGGATWEVCLGKVGQSATFLECSLEEQRDLGNGKPQMNCFFIRKFTIFYLCSLLFCLDVFL